MEEEADHSRMALKVVFILSLLLVTMDILEIYFSYLSIFEYSSSLHMKVFEHCVKYHVLAQMFFTTIATLAGISACIMSLGLLINYEFFATKLLDAFMYYNFYAFGPFLLGSTILGFINFSKVNYNCDNEDYSRQYLNLSTVICLVIALIISLFITVGYSLFSAFELFNNSIRYNAEGNYFLGKLFWKYVFNRGRAAIRHEREENMMELSEVLNEENQERLDQ